MRLSLSFTAGPNNGVHFEVIASLKAYTINNTRTCKSKGPTIKLEPAYAVTKEGRQKASKARCASLAPKSFGAVATVEPTN